MQSQNHMQIGVDFWRWLMYEAYDYFYDYGYSLTKSTRPNKFGGATHKENITKNDKTNPTAWNPIDNNNLTMPKWGKNRPNWKECTTKLIVKLKSV